MELSFSTYLSFLNFVFMFVAFCLLFFGQRKLSWLNRITIKELSPFPKVSIIIAARNEERNIKNALLSILQLDYPNKEVLVVNDRSTDSTASKLTELQKSFPELKLLHITTLPDGWLGKNHALHIGIQETQSELILLTDADIVMLPSTLKRSVSALIRENLDHLALFPKIKVPSFLLNLAISVFTFHFNLFLFPWNAKNPKSGSFIGIGAFNLIRRNAYLKCGGLSKIPLRPDDDVKLGKLIKKSHLRQDVFIAFDFISVEWYASLKEFFKGLEKNVFAGVDYYLSAIFIASIIIAAFAIYPLFGIFIATGATQFFYVLTYIIMIAAIHNQSRYFSGSKYLGFLFPVGNIIYLMVLWNSTLKTLIKGGIEWRGHFYPLKELKKNKV